MEAKSRIERELEKVSRLIELSLGADENTISKLLGEYEGLYKALEILKENTK